MSEVIELIKQEAAEAYAKYKPIITEMEGLGQLITGVSGIVYCIFKTKSEVKSSQDWMWSSSIVVTTVGVIKLTVPITLYSSYRLHRAWKQW